MNMETWSIITVHPDVHANPYVDPIVALTSEDQIGGKSADPGQLANIEENNLSKAADLPG